MRDPSPRAPFDQGLFLKHFNRGKALYEEKRFEESEGELEEAYLLRPRDQNVLNLLGLVYFRQEKLEKAEEVYRKLAAESPEVPVLFQNLGLIYFKLGRLEEAESSFLKALDLAGGNPKINFYLGSIYERSGRFQDAIYQYRQAGANLMVRRVEDKMAAAAPAAARAAGGTGERTQAFRPDDTAEFRARDLEAALRQPDSPLAAHLKTLQPVSSTLMSEYAPVRVEHDTKPPARPGTDTARFRLADLGANPESTLPPVTRPRRAGAGEERSSRGRTQFRPLENNLMEISLTGKVYIRQGTIYSYGGNLTFWVKDRRPGGHPSMVMITGTGKIILTDRDREITFMTVADETLYVEPSHLLACEDTLTPRYVPLSGTHPGLEFLALEGSGMVALSVMSKPLALEVTPDLPVSAPASAVIVWTGPLTARVVEDRHLYEVMRPAAEGATLIRLEGTGRLLMEQVVA
jgi:tetratricopeptide (TPR) repeat protein